MSSKSSMEIGETRKRVVPGRPPGVGDEQEEGLAQGAGADLVAVLEMFDAKFLAGRVNALDDVPAQALVGPLDEGLGLDGLRCSLRNGFVHDCENVGNTPVPDSIRAGWN